MSWSADALQAAVYAALKADVALMAKVDDVYDEPNEDSTLPYVTIGDGTTADWSTKTNEGNEETLTLHAWSDEASRMEAKEILGLIEAALHQQTLTLTGHTMINLRFEFGEVFRDTDGPLNLYHGVIRFRTITQAD